MRGQVTFIHQTTPKADNRESLICRETGLAYSFERNPVERCYYLRREGELMGVRCYRDAALRWIEQTARLDFITAQADSAYSA